MSSPYDPEILLLDLMIHSSDWLDIVTSNKGELLVGSRAGYLPGANLKFDLLLETSTSSDVIMSLYNGHCQGPTVSSHKAGDSSAERLNV